MNKWKCDKCGKIFEEEKPLEHGIMSFSFYPNKPKPIETCNGKLVKIEDVPS